MRVPHWWSLSCLPPMSGKSEAHAELRNEAGMGFGWARAVWSVAGSPTSQKRTNHLLQETLLSIGGKLRGGGSTSVRWNSFDGEQRGLGTVALSPW